MSRFRIAFDGRYINDQYHGIGRYAYRLLEALAAMADGYEFVVFTGRGQDSRFDLDSLTSRSNIRSQTGPWPLYWPHEQLLWPWLLRQVDATLFHSPYFVLPLLSSRPSVNTVHDLIFDRFPSYMPQAWSRPYYRFMMRMSAQRATKTVAVSRATATDLIGHYRISPSQIAVVSEGAEPAFAPVQDEARLGEIRGRYELNRPFVLTVGARRPHKNLTRLVEAFAIVAPRVPHQLVFVGPEDPRFADPVGPAVNGAGLGGRVRFLNWVPEGDLPSLYTLADLVVLPSLIEGFGLPALEAMACGTPVVASDNSAFPEVVGQAGILVDPCDTEEMAAAIGRLLNDPEERRWLAAAGQARAATYTWARAAEEVLEIYEQVLT